MPKSRGRKNKKTKNKTNTSKKRNPNREVFKQNGLELIREGKNVFLKNTRTDEEQKKFNEELAKNRPLQLEKMEKDIERVIEIFTQYDRFILLGALAYNHIAKHASVEDDGLSEVTLEYGLSFATAIKEVSEIVPSNEILHELIDRLIEIRHQYNVYIMTESVTGKYLEIKGQLRFKTILEALYIRGNGYMHHVYNIYKELFSGHDDMLKNKYGFTSNEILERIF
ncbi:MAG: hypothetical protein E2604_01945 [Flavobacterium sp.]|nr:hypothetical protein [Flavobacterium sp.]